MPFLISFFVCTAMALINLPPALDGSMVNIMAMIFCGACALFSMLAAIKTL